MSFRDWIARIRRDIESWAFRAPAWAEGYPWLRWLAIAVKTAATHALVCTAALLVGTLLALGLAVIGIPAMLAASTIVLSVMVASWFYLDRERLAYAKAKNVKHVLDATLDWVVPWLVLTGELYLIGWLHFYLLS